MRGGGEVQDTGAGELYDELDRTDSVDNKHYLSHGALGVSTADEEDREG